MGWVGSPVTVSEGDRYGLRRSEVLVLAAVAEEPGAVAADVLEEDRVRLRRSDRALARLSDLGLLVVRGGVVHAAWSTRASPVLTLAADIVRDVDAARWSDDDVSKLIALIRDGSSVERAIAIGAMNVLRSAEAVPALAAALDDPHPEIGAFAVKAIARAATPEAAAALRGAIHHELVAVRATAVEALGTFCCEQDVEPIASLAGDHHPDVRRAVARSLRRLRSPRAVPALALLLVDVSASVAVFRRPARAARAEV